MLSLLCRRVPDHEFEATGLPATGAVPLFRKDGAGGRSGAGNLLLGMATSVALCLPSARAADFEDFLSHDFGGFLFQPQLDVSEMYTDNLTYSEGLAQIADFQSTFSPGLRVQRRDLSGNTASVEFVRDEIVFLDHTETNYRQNRFKGNGSYRTARLLFDVNQQYDQLAGFLGGVIGQSGIINIASRRRDSWYGTIRTTYDWTARTDLYLDFSNYLTDWAKDVALYDYNILRGALGGTFEATDRVQLFTEVFYGQSGVSANQLGQAPGVASATYGMFVGARGEFTSRFSGTAKVGIENRGFFESGRPGVLIPAFEMNLRFIVTEATALQLQYNRLTSPSVNFGGQNVTSDSAILTATHILGESGTWSMKGSTMYQLADYSNTSVVGVPSTARADDFITAELGLYYRPRPWLTASMGYAFEYYHVSFQNPLLALRNQTGYQANRVFLNLSLGF